MYEVYILKSLKFNHFYTGCTDNLEKRLKCHNLGLVSWTKRYKPWKLIYKEVYRSKSEAFQREKYFKSHSGRDWLKKNIGPRSLMDKAAPF